VVPFPENGDRPGIRERTVFNAPDDHQWRPSERSGWLNLLRGLARTSIGDEKGEAQVFLDRLFRGFGHEGVPEIGPKLEMRVKKSDGKGTSVADHLVWKPVILIEMKNRGGL
jgi:hypothetical protein